MTTRNDVHDPEELVELFSTLAKTLAKPDVSGALQTICDLAVTVTEADHASITTNVRGRFTTVAATDTTAERIDELQERLQEGPCLEAMRDVETHVSNELAHEESWPRFGAAAAEELGVHSIVSHVLHMEDGSVGALNITAQRPGAFSAAHEQLAVVFGAQAGAALRAAREHDRAEHLLTAMRTARRIGMALGIIMRDEYLDEREAFQRLAKASQDSNRKVADLAEDVVRTGALPD